MAVAQKPLENNTSSTHRAVYLLEEILPNPASFVKYIHNNSALPLAHSLSAHFNKAVFLSFVQHAQYQLTHNTMYVSDFQGELLQVAFSCLPLTACAWSWCLFLQVLVTYLLIRKSWHLRELGNLHILLKPDLASRSLGENLFGDGNLGTAFENFPTQHLCSKYCRWFKLRKLQAATNAPSPDET